MPTLRALLQNSSQDGGVMLFVAGSGLFLYFFPSLLAFCIKKQGAGKVFTLNLLLGWTLVGWVIALVRALRQEQPASA